MLHNKVLSVLKHERPERAQSGPRRILECRRTPIHIVATSNPRLPSIELGRRMLSKECLQGSKAHQPTNGLKNPPHNPPSESALATNQPECSSPRKRKQLHPETSEESSDEDCEAPRVIISLALEEMARFLSNNRQVRKSRSGVQGILCFGHPVYPCLYLGPTSRGSCMFFHRLCHFSQLIEMQSTESGIGVRRATSNRCNT